MPTFEGTRPDGDAPTLRRQRNICVVSVKSGTPIPEHVPDHFIHDSKTHYGYDWVRKTTTYDEDTEEEIEHEEYVSREMAIEDMIDMNSVLWSLSKNWDKWIIDSYTKKVVAVVSVHVDVVRL